MADLVGGESEVDIDAIAAQAAQSRGEDLDAEPDTSGADADAQADEGQSKGDESKERTVPEKAYGRLYGENKQKEREIAQLKAENARLQKAGSPAPVTKAPAQGAVSPESEYLQRTMGPVVEAAVAKAVAPFEAAGKVKEAESKLASFWTANPEFVGFKDQLDAVFMGAVQDGNDPKEVNPEMILNALIGQKTRTQIASRRSIATASQAKQAKVNDAATSTSQGSRPQAGAGGATGQGGVKKKFTEMNASEIESAFGKEVIWRRGIHHDELE